MWPEPFPMKHYLFLSRAHAIEKYVERGYDPRRWRAAGTAGAPGPRARTPPSSSCRWEPDPNRLLKASAALSARTRAGDDATPGDSHDAQIPGTRDDEVCR